MIITNWLSRIQNSNHKSLRRRSGRGRFATVSAALPAQTESLEERVLLASTVLGSGRDSLLAANGFTEKSSGTFETAGRVQLDGPNMSAPDGGVATEQRRLGNYVSYDFVPKDGLLTVDNGISSDAKVSQQQRIELKANNVNYQVVETPINGSITTYQMKVIPETTGTYTFYVATRYFYDNERHLQPTAEVLGVAGTVNKDDRAETTTTVNLTAGVEYTIQLNRSNGFVTGYDSNFRFEWSGPNFQRRNVDIASDINWLYRANPSDPFAGGASGFIVARGAFTADKHAGFSDQRTFDFATRYTTNFTVPATGEYQFFVNSDSAAALKFGTDLVVNQTSGEASGRRTFTAGTVINLELGYTHKQGPNPLLKFEWSGPGLSRRIFTTPNIIQYDTYNFIGSDPATLATKTPNLTGLMYNDPETYSLIWKGQRTAPLKIGASAEAVEAALNALSNIGPVGGKVTVTRSTNGTSYTVNFGGTLWFGPPLITGTGNRLVTTTAVGVVALTKRDPNSRLVIKDAATEYVNQLSVPLPNATTFPIQNAAYFTPTLLRYTSNDRVVKFQGYVEVPAIGGRFEPSAKINSGNSLDISQENWNVVRTSQGFRLVDFFEKNSYGRPSNVRGSYVLNPQRDSNGNPRPLTLFRLGGLDFEAPAGTEVTLDSLDGETRNNLEFRSKADTINVTARFEGGTVTLKLLRDGNKPLFTANLQTSKVTVTDKFELVSVQLGGITIPASNSFKMNYDAAADKFNFVINQLNIESSYPTGNAGYEQAQAIGTSLVQNFTLTGASLNGSTYESATASNRGGFTSFAEFEAATKTAGSLSLFSGFQQGAGQVVAGKDYVSNFGARYRTTLTVPKTGRYTFELVDPLSSLIPFLGDKDRGQLKVNSTVVAERTGAFGATTTTSEITLTAGVEYALEYTVLDTFAEITSKYYVGIKSVETGVLRDVSQRFYQETFIDRFRAYARHDYDGRLTDAQYISFFAGDVRDALSQFMKDGLNLSESERTGLLSRTTVEFVGNRLTISGLPFAISLGSQWAADYQRTVASPVKMSIPSGTLTISNGVLAPITNLTVNSFEIGQTTINSQAQFVTTYEPLKPTSPGGFKLAFFQRNTYTKDSAVDVPGNSFGIYGAQSQLPLTAAGVTLNGLADLGTAAAPGVVITNGQFSRLTYSIPDVKVNEFVFKAAPVGSARPLTVNYFPPQTGNRKSYVVLGGAMLRPGSSVVSNDMLVNFGGLGSDGLRIFPDNQSFTFSFGVASTLLAGTQAIESVPGVKGLKLVYDNQTRAYNFQGDAFLDFNPKTTHTATNLAFTGQRLAVSATVPQGVTNFPSNRLDGSTLNFFFGAKAALNGFLFTPRPTSNPLRVAITRNGNAITESVGGAFVMDLDGGDLYGTMDPTPFAGAKFPTAGFQLDFTPVAGQPSGYTLGGITMDGAKKAVLTTKLSLKFLTATYDNNFLAQGTVGAEPVVVEAESGEIKKAEITSTTSRAIGNVTFQSFKATFARLKTGGIWNFVGPGTYFGRQVNVGSPGVGNPQVKIGLEPGKGYSLQTLNKPANPVESGFQLPPVVEVAGLAIDTSLLETEEPTVDEGPKGKVFSIRSRDYAVKIGNTTLSLSLSMKVRVNSSGVSIVSFTGTGKQNSAFTVGKASVQIKTVSIAYNLEKKELQISGQAKFTFKAKNANVDMDITLGTTKEPGLIIKDGAIDSFKVTVDGTFELFKMEVQSTGMTLAYKKENLEFALYGTLKLSSKRQSGTQIIKEMEVSLGDEKTPGIKIANGELEELDITLNGELNLFKLTAKPQDLHVSYSREESLVQIDGAVAITLAPKLTLTAELPGDGLQVNTDTGEIEIKGISLKAEGAIKFGVLTIKELHVDFEKADNGDITIGAGAEVELPSGLAVGGEFKIVNGKLDAIGIVFQKNPGILIANGLINIYRLDVKVEGLSNLDNFKFTGKVSATVGPLVKFAGESQSLANVVGTIIITPEKLTLAGDVDLVGGKLGKGTFEGTLTWTDTARVTFNGKLRLFPGDVIRGRIDAYADIKGNVDFNADIGVFVPNGVPLAGGAELKTLKVELRVRPALEPSASYAKFSFSGIQIFAFPMPTFQGSFKLAFDGIVDFSLGARFYIPLPWPLPNIDYSLDFGGQFSLRDSDLPRIEILAASALPGTPDGEIVYATDTHYPAGTTIDLYADRDNTGNDGLLIASGLPYQDGTQTFTWDNLAAFANPGEPVYVYGVINDGQNGPAYSDYSSRFNVTPGFLPIISTPTSLAFSAGQVATFSAALGNAIVINDPRSSSDPESEIEVVLDVAGGTLDLSHAPNNVRFSGESTSRMTLRGRAVDITDALDGLHYAQFTASSREDALQLTVRNLPLNSLVGGQTATIKLQPNPLVVSMIAAQRAEPVTEITTGEVGQTPLRDIEIDSLNSPYLTGATVTINGYEAGKDFLALNLGEELEAGVDASFDRDTGVLTLTTFDWIDDYEEALRSVTFQTSSLTGGKSLTIALADDDGDRGSFTVPLTVVAGHEEPVVSMGTTGLSYVAGSGQLNLSLSPVLEIADGSRVQSVQVAFVEDSYVPGEDVLRYRGTRFTSNFNADTGVLTLTGSGSEANWRTALRQIVYVSRGETFTEGPRYLEVTVTDNSEENNTTTTSFVIDKSVEAESHASPVLSLSTHELTLPADEEYLAIDPELTLVTEAPMLVGATVAISSNYVMGEDELAVTSLWDGMTADFDPETGVLTIAGTATTFEYEDVLRSIYFIDAAGYRTPGQIGLTYTVLDGLSASEVETATLTIESAPYLSSGLDNASVYTEGRSSEVVLSDISIEHEGTLSGAIVSISGGFEVGEDQLRFVDQRGITGQFNGETGTLTLTGDASVADYEAALSSVRYRSLRFNPVASDRVVTFQVQAGSVLSNELAALITVDPIVVAPNVSLGSGTTYTEDSTPVSIAPEFTLTPADATESFLSAPEELYGAQIDIVNYVPGEDELLFLGSENIVGEFDETEGRIFLTGEATFEEYETAIRNILYRNSSDMPTTTPRQISIRLLESSENGLANQTFVTEVIVSTPDPVTLTNGTADDLQVVENDEPVSLELGDLVFVASVVDPLEVNEDGVTPAAELRFTVTQVPSEGVGRVLLADGSEVEVGLPYDLVELAGLQFAATPGGSGTGEFSFSVAAFDTENNVSDTATYSDSLTITVAGTETSTPTEAYVAQAYRDLTGRNAQPASIVAWGAQLDELLEDVGLQEGFETAERARAEFLETLTTSEAFIREQLNGLYQDLLGRDAADSELVPSVDAARLTLLGSDEFFDSREGAEDYVGAVYEELLGREPSVEELADALDVIRNSSSFAAVVDTIADRRVSDDGALEALFTELLGRDPNFYDEASFDFSSHEALRHSVLASDEYFDQFAVTADSDFVVTHETTDFASVGKLGDIAGDKAGGTLIAPQYVLVAGHSVFGLPPGQLTFTIGGVKHRISDVFIHPDYDPDSLGADGGNDIAILKLDEPVTDIEPSLLARRAPRFNDEFQLVGFGEHEGDKYGTKRVGTTPPVDDIGDTIFRWTHTSELQNDSDAGDSGSPLYFDFDGAPYLVAIVSGGTSVAGGLGDVATNTRVDQYVDWIESITGALEVAEIENGPALLLDSNEVFLDENSGEQRIGLKVAADDTFSISMVPAEPEFFEFFNIDYDDRGEGDVVFKTALNQRGSTSITVTVISGNSSTTETINITVGERNDLPTLDEIAPIVLGVNAGAQEVPLTNITAGLGETGDVRVSIADVVGAKFFNAFALHYEPGATSGSLTFTPNAFSTADGTIELEVRDAGADGVFDTEDDGITNRRVFVDVPNMDAAFITARVVDGVLTINDVGDAATDVRLSFDGDTNKLSVTSLQDGSAILNFTFDAETITNGIRANLGSKNDKFDASSIPLPTTVYGGDGDDTILGSQAADVLLGENGNDVLRGAGGRDSLIGGSGNDSLFGQGGSDTLDGGAGIDVLNGGSGATGILDEVAGDLTLTNTGYLTARGDRAVADLVSFAVIKGSAANESFRTIDFTSGVATVFGGAGNDNFQGGATSDTFYGEDGNDTLLGAGAADVLFGGNGNDIVSGVGGSDILSGGLGDDIIRGGAGNNELQETVAGNITVSSDIETGAVTLTGVGIDRLFDLFGSVMLTGGDGNDVIDARQFNGAATLIGGAGDDSLLGAAGNNRLIGGTGNDTLTGGASDDLLLGDDGNDELNGERGNDQLLGGAGNDTLNGGSGSDSLSGQLGDDVINGGSGNDRITESADADVTIVGTNMSSSVLGQDTSSSIERIKLSGGSGNNRLDGRAASVPLVLNGFGGNDTLLGGQQADLINGGDGDDVLSGGPNVGSTASNDTLNGDAGNDSYIEQADTNFTVSGQQVTSAATGTDALSTIERVVLIGGNSNNTLNAAASSVPVVLLGGKGNDSLIGSGFADTLSGGSRADQLGGADSLDGGSSTDTFTRDNQDRIENGPSETVIDDIFTLLPAWVDAL